MSSVARAKWRPNISTEKSYDLAKNCKCLGTKTVYLANNAIIQA